MTRRRYGRYSVETSNEDKLLFPEAGISKGALIDYYERIADRILPHLEQRPLVLQRFPNGIQESLASDETFAREFAPGVLPQT